MLSQGVCPPGCDRFKLELNLNGRYDAHTLSLLVSWIYPRLHGFLLLVSLMLGVNFILSAPSCGPVDAFDFILQETTRHVWIGYLTQYPFTFLSARFLPAVGAYVC